jgi:hypothetical protein
MAKLIRDFKDNVAVPKSTKRAGHVHHSSPDRRFVAENLILTLVETTQDDHSTIPVASLNDTPHTIQVRPAQRAIGLKGRIKSAFVSRRSALETQRESLNSVGNVVRYPFDELGSVGSGVEIRAVSIFENCIDHPDIHQ